MKPSPTAISSRLEEESRVAGRWLTRVGECLGSGDSSLFTASLAQAGITRENVAHGRGLRLHHVDDAIRSIRQQQPDIRLRMMRSIELPDIGVVGFAAMSSDRIDKALEVTITYHVLTSARFHLTMNVDQDTAVILAIPGVGFLDEAIDIAEDALGGMWRLFELFLGSGARHEYSRASAHLPYPEPSYSDAYAKTFKCPYYFGSESSELRFPSEWLSRRVATANPAVAEVCRATCERILGPKHETGRTREVVARLLLSRSGRRILPLEEAAERMHMSASQLRKRLYRDGTSYKRIVVETRMALAKHYLETSRLSIQNIAYLLDYSEAAAFTRAFKRELGISPQEYREQAHHAEHGESADEGAGPRPLRPGRWVVQ